VHICMDTGCDYDRVYLNKPKRTHANVPRVVGRYIRRIGASFGELDTQMSVGDTVQSIQSAVPVQAAIAQTLSASGGTSER
jgi:hypothetical protein